MNTSFKHVVSHLDDLKIASRRNSDVENKIREQEWKRLHTTSHTTYSAFVHVCLILIGLYVLYKLYNCLKLYECCKSKVPCVKALADANGSGNVVNIKIHTSNESLAVGQEEVPLRELSSQSPEATPRRSSRLRPSVLFLRPMKENIGLPHGGRCCICMCLQVIACTCIYRCVCTISFFYFLCVTSPYSIIFCHCIVVARRIHVYYVLCQMHPF
jgi:hypothetical protein